MTPITVAIITYNESRNIERCIRAVKEVADEILVVDSFSKDNTVELAESLGAKVIAHPFEGHIQQKNYAITQAKFPHILSLDADEWLEERTIKEILEIKQNWQADGYIFNRLNNYCGKWIRHGAWYPDRKLRLWDSRKGKWGGTNPHDEFLMQEGSSIEKINADILHQSYKTFGEHLSKSEYFSEIAARAYFDKGKRSGLFKIIFSPAIRFLRDYIILGGLWDGYYGFVIARLTAREVYLKYSRLRRLYTSS